MVRARILALPKYGDLAASTRQRLLQYLPALGVAGIDITFRPLLDNGHLERLNRGEASGAGAALSAYAARAGALASASGHDAIWLHYEAFPYLPGLFERLAFLPRRPVILDLDDAIFHQYDSHRNVLVRALLGTKLQPLMRRAAACVCGNDYLADYAGRFSDNVHVLPTVLDTDAYRPAARTPRTPVTIGWIGSPTTWRYVAPLVPMLARLRQRHGVRIKVVGAGRLESPPPDIGFVAWSEAREVPEIQDMDIGIMPLPDEPWARGKCGYKLIQYQACGLPVVASPVGANATIVREGENGFLAADEPAFEAALERLIADPDLRRAFGAAGRRNAEERYSLAVHAPRFVAIVNEVLGGRGG